MEYQQFRQAIVEPYWCVNPMAWVDEGVGIGHFAAEGRVGIFNLCWFVLQCRRPPSATVYRNTDLMWVIKQAGGTLLDRRSLEEHAAMRTRGEFCTLILQHCGHRPNVPGHVPWQTLSSIALRSIA